MSSQMAETIRVYATREDSCVSNERLHREKVCVPLHEDHHKDVTKFKSQDMSFTDIKTLQYRRGFAGIKL